MKRFLLFFFLTSSFSSLFSQSGQWTWINGDNYIPQLPVYGTQELPGKDNKPGARQYATTWKDGDGNIWLFGGYGYGLIGNGGIQYLNDLWKYTPSTGQWTWIGGDRFGNGLTVYGTKGIAAWGNKPGARQNSVGWTDAAGNLWLFGGYGISNPTVGYLNDLWKFSPSSGQWTWVSGDNTENQRAIYGTRGAAAAGNKPGAKQNSVGWTDAAGNLWLFGGIGYANYGASSTSDLWKFTLSTRLWTWVGGDTTIEATGVYGVKGTAGPGNKPGARYSAVSWADATGNLWLIGGYGYSEDRFGGMKHLNDLWKFNPATGQWTWMSGDNAGNQPAVYGTKGVAAPGNKPGSRANAVGWTDAGGNLWLHGGRSYMSNFYGNALDDLWKYEPATGLWTWVNGFGSLNVLGIYGVKNTPSPDNRPGSRYGSVSWADTAGNLWLSGGYGYINSAYGVENDLWKYTIATGQWTWVNGDNQFFLQGVYGVKGTTAALNKPGGRQDAATWTDAGGNLWMFGGVGYAENGGSYLNDLWKYVPATGQWTWVKGDNLAAQPGFYGRQGEPSPYTNPSSRSGSSAWADAGGNLWIFGGQTYAGAGPFKYLNDVWKYTPSTDQWTWVTGSNTVNQTGQYGTKGTAASVNTPGARQYATTWTDASGNFWLFGGTGYAGSGSVGVLNDLWKYTPSANEWTWISGDSVTGQTGVYGVQGNSSPGNKPGARSGGTGWLDAAGNLWILGGEGRSAGRSGILNDLWKYTTSTGQWIWMAGDSTPRKPTVYDPANPASAGNKPSSRRSSVSWADASGNLWLFGGEGYNNDTNFVISLNDLWMYAPSTGRWTWKNYPSISSQAVYGTLGTAAPANIPGTRSNSVKWMDAGGKLWIFGGLGYAANGSGLLNDLWQYSIPLTPLPVQFSSFSAHKQQQTVLLNWTTAQEQHSRSFTVERSSTGLLFDSIGSVNAIGWSASSFSYTYIDNNPLSGTGYYRLKQIDQDGKFLYSPIATVVMGEPAAGFAVIQNPVHSMLQLHVQLPATQQLTLQIRDINGQLLWSRNYTGKKGSSQYTLPITHLNNGTYLINMQTGNSITTKIFMKQ